MDLDCAPATEMIHSAIPGCCPSKTITDHSPEQCLFILRFVYFLAHFLSFYGIVYIFFYSGICIPLPSSVAPDPKSDRPGGGGTEQSSISLWVIQDVEYVPDVLRRSAEN